MTSIPDHYAALGIDPTADPEVITAAYRALAKKFHPDTGAAGGTASPERFDEIQKAYEVLRTPESRHAYDLELLAATEAELEQHLASKRRVAVRERERAREAEVEAEHAAAAPDLGDIRPEPAMPPRSVPRKGNSRRSFMPVMIPLLLMMLLGGGAAWLFLPASPTAPPLSGTEQQQVAVAKPTVEPAAEPATPAPAAPADKAATPAPQSAPEQPVFGSSATENAPAAVEEAAATPDAIPAPDAAAGSIANSAAKSDKPVFGSSGEMDAPAAAPAVAPAAAGASQQTTPPPLPKAKPAQPTRQAAQPKPPAKPVQKQVTQPQQQAQLQPRARLQYQDPPQYYPQPDGYPPPGYPTPGYEPPGYQGDYPPPGYDQGYAPPPGFRPPGGGPYRLVIFARPPGQQATAWSAGVVFQSIGKCTKQGVKAVLRRTSMDPATRVWYECQQFTQR